MAACGVRVALVVRNSRRFLERQDVDPGVQPSSVDGDCDAPFTASVLLPGTEVGIVGRGVLGDRAGGSRRGKHARSR